MKVRFFIVLVLFAFVFASSSLFAQGTCNPPCPNPCPTPCPTATPAPTTGSSFQWEISPYAGYVWNAQNDAIGSLINTQVFGVRGGGYVTSALEIGGNWSWNPHFQPKPEDTTAAFAGNLGFPQAKVRTNLWEAEFTYHFGSRGVFGHSVKPYLVAGGGGITTDLKNGDSFVLNNKFFDVPGVSPATLEAAHANGTLQTLFPNFNTTHGVAFVSNPTGTGTTVVLANDVFRNNATYFTFSYGGGIKLQRLWGPLGFFGDVRGRTIPNLFHHQTNMLEVSAGLNFAFGQR